MGTEQGTSLRQLLSRVLLALCATALLAYPVDWAIWRLRLALGNGMGSAVITTTTAATLKGNHYEVYGQDVMPVACSRSFLPEAGAGPCWWLGRHPQVLTQY